MSFQQSCLCSHKEMRFLQQLLLHTKLSPKLANIIMPNINFTIVQGTTILVKASSLLKKTDTQNLVQALTRVRHCVAARPNPAILAATCVLPFPAQPSHKQSLDTRAVALPPLQPVFLPQYSPRRCWKSYSSGICLLCECRNGGLRIGGGGCQVLGSTQ